MSFWFIFAAAWMIICAVLCGQWSAVMPPQDRSGTIFRGQTGFKRGFRSAKEILAEAARAPAAPPDGASGRISEKDGVISAQYNFRNFTGDELGVSFSIPREELARYKSDYGYTDAELDDIDRRRRAAYKSAYSQALAKHMSQAQYNALVKNVERDFAAQRKNFIIRRGFVFRKADVIEADIPQIAKRNSKALNGVAVSLNSSAAKLGYGSEELLSAALAFVQTALNYETPPDIDGENRHTGGVWPPLEALAVGKGDCDTKTALLAAILSNWDGMKLLGVSVPEHYLMGAALPPGKGDLFVEYGGGRYVLMEPAGPAWAPPGVAGERASALLQAGGDYRLEPLN
ncbi:MAG: hypothetical protein WC421_01205 [Elusimicrobiales bacterium]